MYEYPAIYGHTARCVESAVWAIAENNGWTLADDPTTPESDLTPETTEYAVQFLAEGTVSCVNGGEDCNPSYPWQSNY